MFFCQFCELLSQATHENYTTGASFLDEIQIFSSSMCVEEISIKSANIIIIIFIIYITKKRNIYKQAHIVHKVKTKQIDHI